MKTIRIEGITKYYRGEPILKDLSLTIDAGSFFTLLGPSGSGKTTLLRLIAGFETVDAGHIFLDDEDITYLPANQRKVNTVFQQYALFPHLNVFENVAFGLRIKGLSRSVVEQKVSKILKAIHLENHAAKQIGQLSGGQQQRIALARAIVNEPELLLLDEPLAALDLSLRERMLVELVELQEQFKTTFIYVTHDQLEALAVSHQMAIMNHEGHIEQIGAPKKIYEFPVSTFVAQFVGSTNLLKGCVDIHDNHARLLVEGLEPLIIPSYEQYSWAVQGISVWLSLRPEKIAISKQILNGFSNRIQGQVEAILYHGRSTLYRVLLPNGYHLQVFEQNEEHVTRETIVHKDNVYLYWQKESSILLKR